MSELQQSKSFLAFQNNYSSNIFPLNTDYSKLGNSFLYLDINNAKVITSDSEKKLNNLNQVIKSFLEFNNCFVKNNIFVENNDLLIDFFLNNSIDINLLNESVLLIRESFTEDAEISVGYEPDYKMDLNFFIRQNNYDGNDLGSLISKTENIISDNLDHQQASFNITLNTDYNKPKYNNDKQFSRI